MAGKEGTLVYFCFALHLQKSNILLDDYLINKISF